MHFSLLLGILAALCYTVPFIWPTYCCFLIFLFPMFLFLFLTYRPTNHILFYWSFSVITIHLLPICDALLFMADGPVMLRCIPPFLLIFYVTCYPTLWLIITTWFLQRSWCSSIPIQLILWTISSWLYALFIDQELLWVFGRHEGYIFMNPLLPLAACPSMLGSLVYVPSSLLLLLFCVTSSVFTATFLAPKSIPYYLLFCMCLPWLGWPIEPPAVPVWLSKIGHIPLLFSHTIDNQMGTLLLQREIIACQTAHLLVNTFILPESAWNSPSLATLTQLPVLPNSTMLIGGFAPIKDGWVNRLYCFINGQLDCVYDKRHALPLVERTPAGTQAIANPLFFQKSPPIIPATNPKIPLMLPGIGSFIPYICSELFCNTYPDDSYNYPILCLVNDWWFRMPHFQQLMALAARLQAVRWQRSILYISFYYAQFFDEFGRAAPIATTSIDRYIM